jgi:Flp pilus assembly pilin Flp
MLTLGMQPMASARDCPKRTLSDIGSLSSIGFQIGARQMTLLKNLWQDEQGQDLIEYTLLMAFVALASAALFIGAGGSIKGIWSVTNSQLAAASTSAS